MGPSDRLAGVFRKALELGDAVDVEGLTYRGAAANRAAEVAGELGTEIAGIGLDINDEDAVQAAFRGTAKRYGRIDALVAAAGALEAAPVGMMVHDHVDRMMATNVAGTLATLRAATQVMMRKRSGSIVLFGSIAGQR